MKTVNHVLRETEYKTLVRSVIRNIGIDSVQDVNRNGISGGFSGFIYHSDTVKFFDRHRKDILSLSEEMSKEFGTGVLEMIQGFNCVGKGYTLDEIARAIYQGKGDAVTQIKNAMSWFAAEEVCRMFED